MADLIIRVTHFGKKYGSVCALKGMDLGIMRGEFCVIAGPNGAGKSTFLRILYGEVDPSEGEIALAELPAPMGVMPQEAGLYDDLSV
jgi:ABC-2 type transport system ATP-binding protein